MSDSVSGHRPLEQGGERGAILPVAAVLLTSLLLMSALVVDIGRLSLERRADQSAVDVAAIAGAMDRSSEPALIEAVRTTLNRNLTANFSAADLHTCGTDTLPSGWMAYPAANCLAHDPSWTQLRVRVPTQSFSPAFASLAGITELNHSAIAQVYDRRAGLVIPFGLSATAGSYECVKVGAGNVPDPACSGPTSGNFGIVTIGLWGNTETGTTTDCTGTGTQFVVNVAQGADHDLSIWDRPPHGTVDVVDTTSCGATPYPNAVTTTTGNTPNRLGAALFGPDTYPDGGPSRLRRVSGTSWMPTTTITGATVDDTPLWEFIPAGLGWADHVPRSCHKNQFIGVAGGLNVDNDMDMTALPLAVANHLILVSVEDRMIKLIERCLAHYEGNVWDDGGALTPADPPVGCGGVTVVCTDPVFALDTIDAKDEQEPIVDIQASARFAYVPQMVPGTVVNGNTTVRIGAFRAIYLQRVYGGNCNPSGCPITWDPGVGYSSTVSTDKASALTAFVFPPGILPNGLSDPDALDRYGVNRFIQLTR